MILFLAETTHAIRDANDKTAHSPLANKDHPLDLGEDSPHAHNRGPDKPTRVLINDLLPLVQTFELPVELSHCFLISILPTNGDARSLF